MHVYVNKFSLMAFRFYIKIFSSCSSCECIMRKLKENDFLKQRLSADCTVQFEIHFSITTARRFNVKKTSSLTRLEISFHIRDFYLRFGFRTSITQMASEFRSAKGFDFIFIADIRCFSDFFSSHPFSINVFRYQFFK